MSHWRSTGTTVEIEAASRALCRIHDVARRLGSPVKPGSRVAVFEESLRRFSRPGYRPLDDPDFDAAAMAHGARDMDELGFICDVLAESHAVRLAKALPHLLGGEPVPAADQHHQPRNLQFEFFLGAYLKHSGYTVALDEPDVLFIHEGSTVGVAAKRCVSRAQIIRRVKKGVRQLAAAGVPGFVALSLDRLAPWPNAYFVARDEAALDDVGQRLLQDVSTQFAARIHRTVAPTSITGVIFSFTAVGCVSVPWQPAHVNATLWLPRTDGLAEEENIVRRVVESLRSPGEEPASPPSG